MNENKTNKNQNKMNVLHIYLNSGTNKHSKDG